MFADKSLLTQKEKRLKSSGQQELMMKWLKWLTVMHQFGRCMRTLGIQFQVSYLFVFIQITISEYPTHSLNMSKIQDFITWWQRIRSTFQKTKDHSPQKRIRIVPKKCGGLKRTWPTKTTCAIPTGTRKALITISIRKKISPEKKKAKTYWRDQNSIESQPYKLYLNINVLYSISN